MSFAITGRDAHSFGTDTRRRHFEVKVMKFIPGSRLDVGSWRLNSSAFSFSSPVFVFEGFGLPNASNPGASQWRRGSESSALPGTRQAGAVCRAVLPPRCRPVDATCPPSPSSLSFVWLPGETPRRTERVDRNKTRSSPVLEREIRRDLSKNRAELLKITGTSTWTQDRWERREDLSTKERTCTSSIPRRWTIIRASSAPGFETLDPRPAASPRTAVAVAAGAFTCCVGLDGLPHHHPPDGQTSLALVPG